MLTPTSFSVISIVPSKTVLWIEEKCSITPCNHQHEDTEVMTADQSQRRSWVSTGLHYTPNQCPWPLCDIKLCACLKEVQKTGSSKKNSQEELLEKHLCSFWIKPWERVRYMEKREEVTWKQDTHCSVRREGRKEPRWHQKGSTREGEERAREHDSADRVRCWSQAKFCMTRDKGQVPETLETMSGQWVPVTEYSVTVMCKSTNIKHARK